MKNQPVSNPHSSLFNFLTITRLKGGLGLNWVEKDFAGR
jgi:hypothetical protein